MDVLDVDVDKEPDVIGRLVKIPQARIDEPEVKIAKVEEARDESLPRIGGLTLSEPPVEPNSHRRKHSNEYPNLSKSWTNSPRRSSFNHNHAAEKTYHPRHGAGSRKPGGASGGGGSLVEKPNAPIPLTNAGLLPAGKVIRLLARGEKLEP